MSLKDAQLVMDRSPDLQLLDVVGPSGGSQAFRRSQQGSAYRSQDVLYGALQQSVWF